MDAQRIVTQVGGVTTVTDSKDIVGSENGHVGSVKGIMVYAKRGGTTFIPYRCLDMDESGKREPAAKRIIAHLGKMKSFQFLSADAQQADRT